MSSMCWAVWAKELADLDAALAVLLELERRGKRRAGLPLGRQIRRRQSSAGVFCQSRLGIERIDVARSAVHEQVNDPLGLRRKMRRPLGQRILVAVHRRRLLRRASRPPSASTPASPSMAKPMPLRRSSSRRVSEHPIGCSIDIHHLIGQQQQLGIVVPTTDIFVSSFVSTSSNKLPADCQLVAVGQPIETPVDKGLMMRSSSFAAHATSGRAASDCACSTTNGEFIRNSACCGTVVRGRRGLLDRDWRCQTRGTSSAGPGDR